VSLSKQDKIALFSCCTADTNSISCEMVVTCKLTIWDLPDDCVCFFYLEAPDGDPLSADFGVFFALIAIFTIDTESLRDSSSA